MTSKIVFFGDSITAANRTSHDPLGDGYVSILNELFNGDNRLNQFQFVNSGINGHTVRDLLQRYKTDVFDHTPDAVVIMIGINDAYIDFHDVDDDNDIPMYQSGLEKLINTLQEGLNHTQFFLFTPYLIVQSPSDKFYLKMAEYCRVVKSLGHTYALPVLDVQSVFNEAVKARPAREWADDQIHPHRDGHDLIARAAFRFLEGHLLKT